MKTGRAAGFVTACLFSVSGCAGAAESAEDQAAAESAEADPPDATLAAAADSAENISLEYRIDSATASSVLEIVYVPVRVTSSPFPAEVYLVPESVAQRDPGILAELDRGSPYYRGLTSQNGLHFEELERSYFLIVRDSVGEDRRIVRLRRGEKQEATVQLR